MERPIDDIREEWNRTQREWKKACASKYNKSFEKAKLEAIKAVLDALLKHSKTDQSNPSSLDSSSSGPS